MLAGLVGRAMYAFESVGWFGYFGFPTSARPWQNQILYDWSARCPINIQDNWACGILYAIIGYQVRLLACGSMQVLHFIVQFLFADDVVDTVVTWNEV